MSNKKRIGFLTIGQSPRDDIMVELKPLLAPDIEVVEYGLLDGLAPEAIASLAPHEKETLLVSRLRDGGQVMLSEAKIRGLLSDAVGFMNREIHVEAVGILCTHEFPEKKYPCPVIFPFELMKSRIDEIAGVPKLGVVVPLENQLGMTEQKWGDMKTFVVAKSPYAGGKTWRDIANILTDEKIDAVILDCIGFTVQDRNQLAGLLNVPIMLPRTILASAINQIF